jgi:hypothetical protein
MEEVQAKILDNIMEKDTQTTSSIEKMKIPELESENYKIDLGLSEEEKKSLKVGETKNDVIKKKILAYFHVGRGDIIVLKKQIEGAKKNAFVWEYMDEGVLSERHAYLA